MCNLLMWALLLFYLQKEADEQQDQVVCFLNYYFQGVAGKTLLFFSRCGFLFFLHAGCSNVGYRFTKNPFISLNLILNPTHLGNFFLTFQL